MTSSHKPIDELFISRHCIQQCLHAAQQANEGTDSEPYLGLLGGNNRCFSAILPIPASTLNANSATSEGWLDKIKTFSRDFPLLASFVSSHGNADAMHELRDGLNALLQLQGIQTPPLYAHVEMANKGRIEIHCFDDANTHNSATQEIPVSMLEDGALYPPAANQ